MNEQNEECACWQELRQKSSICFSFLGMPLCGKADREALLCQPPGNAGEQGE